MQGSEGQWTKDGEMIFMASFFFNVDWPIWHLPSSQKRQILENTLICVKAEQAGSNGVLDTWRHRTIEWFRLEKTSRIMCLGFLKPKNQFPYYCKISEFLSHSCLLHTLQSFSTRTVIWDQTCKYMDLYKQMVLLIKF